MLPSASASEIKRAYRKKAKELHPDTSRSSESVTEEFRRLVRAYEILSDAHQRSIFDSSFTHRRAANPFRSEHSFDYREWLSARPDEESRAKLILFDLLHLREDDAVAEFVRMSSEHADFSLAKWLTREDFMDFGFILCEELVMRAQYYDAAVLLIQIVEMEYRFSYFKHFFPEVVLLARSVLLNKLEGAVSDELALDAWERALELDLGSSDDAALLVKMAGAYIRMDDAYTARICLEEAVKLDRAVKIPSVLHSRFSVNDMEVRY